MEYHRLLGSLLRRRDRRGFRRKQPSCRRKPILKGGRKNEERVAPIWQVYLGRLVGRSGMSCRACP